MSIVVVDSSALVAIATEEPECDAFIAVLEAADDVLISPMNYVETGVVLMMRGVFPDRDVFNAWLADYRVRVAHEPALDAIALDAYVEFGKGRHPAKLNLADCFAYALAKALDAPLLFKGDDFPQTDIRSTLD